MNKTDKFFSSMAVTFQWEKSDKHTNKQRKKNKEHKIAVNVLEKIKQGEMMETRGQDDGLF